MVYKACLVQLGENATNVKSAGQGETRNNLPAPRNEQTEATQQHGTDKQQTGLRGTSTQHW
jgi:hypothetical protein